MTYQDDVKLFMRLAGQQYCKTPTLHAPDSDMARLSIRLLQEEVEETVKAIESGDFIEIADGLVDIVYVVLGIANRYGIDFSACWEEIHRSNVAKVKDGAQFDEWGKVVKPADWTGPDLKKALKLGA